MASLDMLPQYVIDEIIAQMDREFMNAALGVPTKPSLDTFVAFLRSRITHMDQITNGNVVRINYNTIQSQLPLSLRNASVPLKEALSPIVHAALDLEVDFDMSTDEFIFRMIQS